MHPWSTEAQKAGAIDFGEDNVSPPISSRWLFAAFDFIEKTVRCSPGCLLMLKSLGQMKCLLIMKKTQLHT